MDWSPSTEIKETRRAISDPMLTYRREKGEVVSQLGAEDSHQKAK
jgi:hypothetical protein